MSRAALLANGLDAVIAGTEDAEVAVSEGADPGELAGGRGDGPDEALINAMGRGWVLDAAGAPDHSDGSWDTHGLPWCQAYCDAYRARAKKLASTQVSR